MGDMLSQAEIDALLGGAALGSLSESQEPEGNSIGAVDAINEDPAVSQSKALTDEQKDILGEIGNISMGTAATTLFTLLNHKVMITTPTVLVLTWEEFANLHDRPCVAIRVNYKEGLIGTNILILKENDVKIIANLMMGGDGRTVEGDLTDIDMSAIEEAMNQMVGSSATSLSSLIKTKIDIMTPNAFRIDFNEENLYKNLGLSNPKEEIICVAFRMEIGDLIDSQIMQMLPTEFALSMVEALMGDMAYEAPEEVVIPPKQEPVQPEPVYQEPYMNTTDQSAPPQEYSPPPQAYQPPPQGYQQPAQGYQPQPPQGYQTPPPGYAPQPVYAPMAPAEQQYFTPPPQHSVNVQSVQFQNFDFHAVAQQKENIGIIMDVPLEVTVELGRTSKLIKEILEFSPGTVVELDRLAGEPIDVFVNGKFVAKGEVVVIDENFGVRITDIVSVENRI